MLNEYFVYRKSLIFFSVALCFVYMKTVNISSVSLRFETKLKLDGMPALSLINFRLKLKLRERDGYRRVVENRRTF